MIDWLSIETRPFGRVAGSRKTNWRYGKGIFIMTSKEQLERDVKDYVATLEGLVSGDCEWFYNDYCNTEDDREEYADSYARISKFFEDVLDIEIVCDLQGCYRGARVALGLGGPNVYFNTRKGCVEGYTFGDYAEWHVKSFAVDAIDEYVKGLWEMSRGC